MEHLSKNFWKSRYQNDTTGWDLGIISPPIKAYFDQVEDKSVRILIPGCGNGHEAEYLFNNGFKNVHVIDLAEEALANLKSRVPEFPDSQLHLGDFFKHDGEYDIVVEQTMFCAIDPKLRAQYASKVHELLSKGGKLVGLLFDHPFETGPPYGGSKEEYLTYFQEFTSISIEPCYNSVEPRQGGELFIRIVK
jgi:methyl halide transferase